MMCGEEWVNLFDRARTLEGKLACHLESLTRFIDACNKSRAMLNIQGMESVSGKFDFARRGSRAEIYLT